MQVVVPYAGEAVDSREGEMKCMILTCGDQSALAGRSPEWIQGMIEFMNRISEAAEAAIEVRQCMDAPPDET